MIVGLIVLVLLAVGVWWYMGNGTATTDTPETTTTGATVDVSAEVE